MTSKSKRPQRTQQIIELINKGWSDEDIAHEAGVKVNRIREYYRPKYDLKKHSDYIRSWKLTV